MRDLKNKFSNRLLAALLSVAMVITMIPVSMIADAATANHPDTVTITVVDENGQAIKDASVEVTVDSVINGDAYIKETKTTGEDGVVDVMESSVFVANDFTISAKIIATGYADGTLAATKIESADANFEIALVSTTINDVTIEGKTLTYTGSEQELVSVTKVEGDTITYAVDGGEATTETPVATDVCSHEIQVTVSRPGKEDLVKTVTAKIEPADIGVDISPVKGLKYNEAAQQLVTLEGSFLATDTVTWTVNGIDTGSRDIPKDVAVGTYKVKLTVNRGTNYIIFEKEVSVDISLGEINLGDLEVEANDRVYNGNLENALIVSNQGSYDLEYRVGEEGTWTKNVIPKIKEADSYKVYVKATKSGYNEQNLPVFPIVVTISKASQTFDFDEYDAQPEDAAPEAIVLKGTLPYNKIYNFSATDEKALAGGAITYSVIADSGVASIDADGMLEVDYPGEITVVATLSGNRNYKECSIQYKLDVSGEVEKEGQYIEFEDEELSYVLGTSDTIAEQKAEKRDDNIKGSISYTISPVEGVEIDREDGTVIVSDYDELANAIREKDGKLEIIVTATKAKYGGYGKDSVSYKIVVSFGETPDNAYTLPDVDGTNNWYKTKVVVTAADGYNIAKNASGPFEKTTTFDDEGQDARYVYLKDEFTGAITNRIKVVDANGDNIKIDSDKPEAKNVTIVFEEDRINFIPEFIQEFIQDVKVWLGYTVETEIRFLINDETASTASGVSHIEWTYTKEDGATESNESCLTGIQEVEVVEANRSVEGPFVAILRLPIEEAEQYRGRISFVVYDIAGNCSDTGKVEKDEKDTVIITDTIAPVIEIKYHNENVVDELEDSNHNLRKYYNAEQKATIKITELNFDEKLVNIQISATDVAGNHIEDLETKLGEMSKEWKHDGNEHTVTITYSDDANYTFDIACEDLAGNEGVVDLETEEKYQTDYFTVDQTVPTTVSVVYDESVLDTVLNNISFGFYKEKVKVTLTATDDTSGVHSFLYSYRKASGISAVNAELLNQAIEAAEITYSDDNKTATVEFYIPKDVLKNDNQFNGNVEFTATDRSGNVSALHEEEQRIVVDNIAPTAEVIYNSPVNVEGDISYYNGDIKATVTVNEANFYASDVQVMVSKDGGAAIAVTPTWTDMNVDVHVGTFTLREDGDYIITINYTDKSSNAMATYTSKQMTIDTEIKKPTYSINGVAKNEVGGAYKNDAVIAFNFEDENFDTNTIKLERTRFDSVEDVTDEFIKVTKNEKGGSGKFTIPVEVENDGIYVLTIGMTDKAKHSTQSQLKFTINRYGSVYEYDKYLSSLIKDGGQYITISEGNKEAITEDLVITEYNADRLLAGSLKILITRDGQTIKAEYTTDPAEMNGQVAVGDSGWYQYEYTISKKNFKQDGVYKITLTSAYATSDSASNESTSVPENSIDDKGNQIVDTMGFVVDTEAPEIRNVVNLEKAIVDKDKIVDGKLTVKYTIVDVGGLKSIEIIVNGETIDTITEFGENVFNYSGEFVINESNDAKAQTVQIRVTDLAGNVTDTAAEDFSTGDLYVFNGEVTVSTNFFVRWYANKPLFWGSIAGVIIIAGAICFIIVAKRKKQEEE